MKTAKIAIVVSNVLLAASLGLLNGCATKTGYETGEKTAANIQSAANEISALPGQIDKTLASLKDLVEKPQADLRPQFKEFIGNMDKVSAAAGDIKGARSSMAEKGKEFFAKWDEQLAQIKNEDIKARSQSRKDEVAKNLAAIKTSYAEAEMNFKPFMSDLQDIQKYLSADLTTSGIAAIKDTVMKANEKSGPLKTSITKLADDFKALGVSMSSVTAPAAPAAETAPAEK